MIDTRLILALTIAVNIAIGVVVLLSNPNRKQNVFLFIFSMVFAVWGLLVLVIISSLDAAVAEFFIRLVSYFSTLIPVAFNLLCLAIANPYDTFRGLIRRSRALIVASQLIGLVSFTPFFITTVITHHEAGHPLPFPEAVYGPAFRLHSLYFLMSFLLIIINFIRHMRRSEGVQHEEFRFIILGMSVSATVGVTTNILIPYLTGSSQSQPLGPLSTVAMNAIVAYGIATSRILDVGYILRRAAAYMLLTAQLAVMYAACWYGLSVLLEPVSGDFPLPHMLAAIIVALSPAPAHGRMQQFANRLFINYPTANVEETIALANHVLQSITTLDDLLARFTRVIQQALGTDRIAILLEQADAYVQAYPPPTGSDDATLTDDDPLIDTLREAERPLVADLLVRERPTRHLHATTEQMKKMNAAAAVGIRTKGELDGVLILGPRLSGRIYGLMEQNLLQLLCNQLAVALENAKLYTEIQDSKVYHEILLDHLASGVIAANVEGIVTVYNREAQRMVRMPLEEVLHQPFKVLPAALREALYDALYRHQQIQNRDLRLRNAGDEDIPIRIGSTIFRGYQGRILGALILFNDQSVIRKLEEQVRRTDRLASLGTLSAGMAHEIKNPLVSIKTFTELLPQRYEDPDFRSTFSDLVGSEVKRIDRIVNQLLRFARPAKPVLQRTSLHEVLDNALRLIDQQLLKKNIRLTRRYLAPADHIQGDANLLEQAFINFFLNAIDAMSNRGELTVSSREVRFGGDAGAQGEEFPVRYTIEVTIRDNGEGIREEDLPHVFDPFFTTKGHGTGLGLAVAHGIMQEHKAVIDVESGPGEGTAFHIVFPLVQTGVPA